MSRTQPHYGPGSPKQYHEWRQKADSFDAIEIKGSIIANPGILVGIFVGTANRPIAGLTGKEAM
jgi:hypothetical protein